MSAIEVPVSGGPAMGGHLTLPESGEGPGVLVLMEIFGVGSYIRRATERLAELGYVALAPDLYRRIAPGLELGHDQDGLTRALETVSRLDQQGAVEDSLAALAALRERPEVGGRPVGVLGFCLGGSLAYFTAANADPAAAVCYYGSAIPDALDQADRIECPVLFHFGAQDEYIPLEAAERVCAVASGREGWECHVQPDGGHAFDNHDSPIFSRPAPAARAWEITKEFLARNLG
ncbi:MAG TPA: dienelactone hydrolase family protein [Solirubrobacteraceae bacterium]|nr:dienelactone hydrolase family protein [Solirubrobacteraceae bacterium]